MVRRVPSAIVVVAAAMVALAASGCGGGGDDDPAKYQGAAASVVSQFWEQERAAERLPQGHAVRPIGSQGIRALDDGDADARICVEYQYVTSEAPFETYVRVYVATLEDDGWSVEPLKDDGSCEDDDVA